MCGSNVCHKPAFFCCCFFVDKEWTNMAASWGVQIWSQTDWSVEQIECSCGTDWLFLWNRLTVPVEPVKLTIVSVSQSWDWNSQDGLISLLARSQISLSLSSLPIVIIYTSPTDSLFEFSSVSWPVGLSGGHYRWLHRDSVPMFSAGGHCEQFWHIWVTVQLADGQIGGLFLRRIGLIAVDCTVLTTCLFEIADCSDI